MLVKHVLCAQILELYAVRVTDKSFGYFKYILVSRSTFHWHYFLFFAPRISSFVNECISSSILVILDPREAVLLCMVWECHLSTSDRLYENQLTEHGGEFCIQTPPSRVWRASCWENGYVMNWGILKEKRCDMVWHTKWEASKSELSWHNHKYINNSKTFGCKFFPNKGNTHKFSTDIIEGTSWRLMSFHSLHT